MQPRRGEQRTAKRGGQGEEGGRREQIRTLALTRLFLASLSVDSQCLTPAAPMVALARSSIVLLLGLIVLCCATTAALASTTPHSNNWAVLVSTSRYWFNYRHTANALSVYDTVKAMGIPDSQILLMIPDEYACNPRNPFPGSMFSHDGHAIDLYPRGVEVDYRGTEVTVESFLRLLTGRHSSDATPRSKRLLTDEGSNILIYLSGHGGNNFLKFQDNEELNSQDLRDAIQQMKQQKRYRSILFMLDTCQAGTLFRELNPEDTPNVITIGSSRIGQNSYSVRHAPHAPRSRHRCRSARPTPMCNSVDASPALRLRADFLPLRVLCLFVRVCLQLGNDYEVGVSLVDRFTFQTGVFFERNRIVAHHNEARGGGGGGHHAAAGASGLSSRKTVADLFRSYSFAELRSDVEYRADMLQPSVSGSVGGSVAPHPTTSQPDLDPLAHLPLTDYFGAVTPLQPSQRAYELKERKTKAKAGAAATKPTKLTTPAAIANAATVAAARRQLTRKQRTVSSIDRRLPTLHLLDLSAWWTIAAGALGTILLTFILDSACSNTRTKQPTHRA